MRLLSVKKTVVSYRLETLKSSLQLCINPRKDCSETDITELLGFRNKSILTGDLNAKHPVKFQTPQAWSSWNYLLVLTSKFQLHNALRIAHLTVEAMSRPWNIRTSDS
jgi:hypothetical protein